MLLKILNVIYISFWSSDRLIKFANGSYKIEMETKVYPSYLLLLSLYNTGSGWKKIRFGWTYEKFRCFKFKVVFSISHGNTRATSILSIFKERYIYFVGCIKIELLEIKLPIATLNIIHNLLLQMFWHSIGK